MLKAVNTKRIIGYKINEESNRSNKPTVPYQNTVTLPEEKYQQLQRQNELNLTQHIVLKTKRTRKRWILYMSKHAQPKISAELCKTIQAMNKSKNKKD